MNKVILIADDEAILTLSLKQSLLLRYGSSYRYETVTNGEIGLQRLDDLNGEGYQVALVLSDWLMPRMRGDQFLAAVHKKFPETKLILLTGHADEAEIEYLTSKVKLTAALRKPWREAHLFEILDSALA